MKVSKAGSMSGWSFWTWLKRNKDTVKAILVICVSVGTYYAVPTLPQGVVIAGAGFSGLVTKLVVDSIDFWITDVELTE